MDEIKKSTVINYDIYNHRHQSSLLLVSFRDVLI